MQGKQENQVSAQWRPYELLRQRPKEEHLESTEQKCLDYIEQQQQQQQQQKLKPSHVNLIMPYPQQGYGQRNQFQQMPARQFWSKTNNMSETEDSPNKKYSYQDGRERRLTTFSFLDRIAEAEQRPPTTTASYHTSPGRHTGSDPQNGERASFDEPSAEHTRDLRVQEQMGKFGWRPFTTRGRKYKKKGHGPKPLRDISSYANLKDPALERNQQATLRPTSDSSEDFVPHRTPPARFAALHNQQTAPMPAHLSTSTALTAASFQSHFVQAVGNDALVLGNSPMIPTRDGNYAAKGMPRTVQGQPITSMKAQLDFCSPERNPNTFAEAQAQTQLATLPQTTYSPEPSRHAFSPKHSSPLAQVTEDAAPLSNAPCTTLHNNSDPAKTSTSNTILSPSAPAFTPGLPCFTIAPANEHFTLEQLITRVDRLQLKAEQDRQTLMQFLGRETEDRKAIAELRQETAALRKGLQEANQRVALASAARTPADRLVSREIGAGWYGQL